MKTSVTRTSVLLAASTLLALAGTAWADQVIRDDLIVTGSVCIGLNCANGEDFGVDSFRIKDNNVRLHFEDDSTPGSFPVNDWRIVINGAGQGAAEFFAVEDATAERQPFLIEAGAIPNALYVSDDGDVGLGTSTPLVELHAVDGNSPALRLEQDGSSGFAAQTWDIVGNEENFAVRDVTNGDRLSFRVWANTPQDALVMRSDEAIVNEAGLSYDFRVESFEQTNAFFVEGDSGRIGMGTNTPEQAMHVQTDTANTDAFALFDAAGSGSDAAFLLRQNGTAPTTWEFRNQQSSGRLNVGIAGGNTPFKIDDLANNNLLRLGLNGAPGVVAVTGELRVNNTALNVPDYVFADDYALRPLAEVAAFIDTNAHLPEVPSAAEIAQDGVNMSEMQMLHLKKIEELTLYTLEQQRTIDAQAVELAEIATLRARLTALEARVD